MGGAAGTAGSSRPGHSSKVMTAVKPTPSNADEHGERRSEMDPITLTAAAACGLLLGAPAAYLLGLRAGRAGARPGPDWKLRLRARDDDLAAAQERAAEAEVALQTATAALAEAQRRLTELDRHRAPAVVGDPGARLRPADDLTLVPGLGAGDAAVLHAGGVTTFEALAALGAEGAVVPENIADQLADRLPEWADDARRLSRFTREDPR